MEIHDKPVHENRPLRRNAAERPIDFTRPRREGLRAFREMQAEGDRAEAERGDRLELSAEARELADLFCRGARRRIKRLFADLWHNDDDRKYRTARRILDGHHQWLEAGLVEGQED